MAKKKKKTKVAKKKPYVLPPEGPEGIIHLEAGNKKIDIPKVLYDRAKKIGVTDDKIGMYPDTESLKQFLDSISPQTNPDAKVKAGVLPEPKVYDKNMPDIFELESKLNIMEPKNRVQFDEANLQAELRRINRKYGAQKPVRITSDKSFNITRDKNKLNQGIKVVVTKFKIFFKG